MSPTGLAILAKAAVPGRVKTRLVPPLTVEEAARVAQACLVETLERLTPSSEVLPILFLDGPSDREIDTCATRLGIPTEPQAAGDLGERLQAAFDRLRRRGAQRAIAIGSDSPTLDPTHIESAAAALDQVDLVIGPAEDGGYYLIGARKELPSLFRAVPWGSADVARVTIQRAERAGLSVRLLPPWYDVDDITTLRRAVGESAGLRARLAPLLDRLFAMPSSVAVNSRPGGESPGQLL